MTRSWRYGSCFGFSGAFERVRNWRVGAIPGISIVRWTAPGFGWACVVGGGREEGKEESKGREDGKGWRGRELGGTGYNEADRA